MDFLTLTGIAVALAKKEKKKLGYALDSSYRYM